MTASHHPEGWRRAPGGRMRYRSCRPRTAGPPPCARGAPASLPGADIGTAFGDPPGGLAEPLEPDWRGTPVRGPHRPLGRAGPVPGEVGWADAEWAGREYAGGMHTDGRVRRRPGEMGKRGGSVPAGRFRRSCPARRNSGRPIACCPTPGSGWNILAGHTAGRHAGAAAPGGSFPRPGHDDADCDGLAATGGPGSPGGGGKGGRGILAHVGMAVNAAGRPLGMFPWTRSFAGPVKGTAPAGRRVPAGQWSLTRPAPEPGWFPRATGRAISGSFWPAPGTDRRRSRCGPANPQGAVSSRGTGKSGTCGGVSGRPRRWAGGSPGHRDPGMRRPQPAVRARGPADAAVPGAGPLPPRDVGGLPMRMPAVPTGEGNPPAAVARKGGAPGWMPRTTEGEPGPGNACTVLRWHQLRWRTGRFLHALKVGTRTGDRGPEAGRGRRPAQVPGPQRHNRVPGLEPHLPGARANGRTTPPACMPGRTGPGSCSPSPRVSGPHPRADRRIPMSGPSLS